MQSIRPACIDNLCLTEIHSNAYCCTYNYWRVFFSTSVVILWMIAMAIFVRYQRRAAARTAYEQWKLEGQRCAVDATSIQEEKELVPHKVL